MISADDVVKPLLTRVLDQTPSTRHELQCRQIPNQSVDELLLNAVVDEDDGGSVKKCVNGIRRPSRSRA